MVVDVLLPSHPFTLTHFDSVFENFAGFKIEQKQNIVHGLCCFSVTSRLNKSDWTKFGPNFVFLLVLPQLTNTLWLKVSLADQEPACEWSFIFIQSF